MKQFLEWLDARTFRTTANIGEHFVELGSGERDG